MAILQFHLENWPGFGMAKHPANKAVYINPARECNIYFAKHLCLQIFLAEYLHTQLIILVHIIQKC